MGVKLGDIIVAREVRLEDLSGKTILLDAFNMLYQFLATIRAADGTLLKTPDERVTSHLVGLVNRTVAFIEAGMLPVYVFDGESPALKEAEREKRLLAKAEAAEKLEEALKAGDEEAVRKYAPRTASLNEEMIRDAKRVLGLLGVPIVNAPSEAEAEAAFLVKQGRGWAVGSEDYDSLVFGAPRLVRHLAVTGRRVKTRQGWYEVKPEVIVLDEILGRLGITREDLIIIAILVGTDFNPGGVKGIGVKRAVELVKEYRPDYDALFQAVDWSFPFSWRDVYEIFAHPRVENAGPFRLEEPAYEESRRVLVEEYAFNAERVDRLLARLRHARQAGRQSSLSRFVKK